LFDFGTRFGTSTEVAGLGDAGGEGGGDGSPVTPKGYRFIV